LTLMPFDERHKVSGAVGPTYTIRGICCAPDCMETSVDRHHLCRRSALGGPFDWIEYEGVLIQNVVGLCRAHHQLITDNKARIWWTPFAYFAWVSEGKKPVKINPHPVIDDGSHSHEELNKAEVLPDVCPGCGRVTRPKSAKREEKRQRASWSIHVPKDERENGADVLDTLLEEARVMMAKAGLPYGDEANARYFILSAVLALFVQHSQEVMSDA